MIRKLKILLNLPLEIWQMIISYLPGQVGFILRYKFWKRRLKYLGKDVKIDTGVYFQNPNYISINDNCWIDKNVSILAGIDCSNREKIKLENKNFKEESGVVYIGKNVHIGLGCIISGISAGVYISDDCGFSANCKIYAFSHHYRSRKEPSNTAIHFGPMVSEDRQCLIEGPVYIGANTGAALNSIILPGVSIPENCFVAINSVVDLRRHVKNSILEGNPAKRSGDRFKLDA